MAYQQIEKLKPKVNIQCIRWKNQHPMTVKLNTDGCNKGNPGSAGEGGILRSESDQLIMAYVDFFGTCSNNIIEAKAILVGMQWCTCNGCFNVLVENDSIIIIGMINRSYKSSWKIKYIIKKIIKLKAQENFLFQHCYREANCRADFLANIGEHSKQNLFFTYDLALP